MKLSFSTNAFVRYDVDAAVECIAALGYRGVELLADAPHLYAPSVTDAALDRLKRILDRTGIAVANVNANTAMGYYGRGFWEPLFEPSLANPDPQERAWRIAYTKRCIDLARELGARNISVTSGRCTPATAPETSRRLLVDALVDVLDYAEKREIRVGIEYEPGLLVECYEELNELLEEVDSPWLGANLDLGHSHVLGEDPAVVIGGLGPRIFHIHIEDIRARKHYHLIPGRGDLDFEALWGLLRKHAYEGFVSVELYTYPHEPEEAARESLHYLRGVVPR